MENTVIRIKAYLFTKDDKVDFKAVSLTSKTVSLATGNGH